MKARLNRAWDDSSLTRRTRNETGRRSQHTFRMVTASLLLALTAGCGYHVSGHGDMLPKTIHTIAIPAFGNVTARYKLARLLPTDIGRELISRTGYKIVAEPNEADAVLTGTVHNFVAYPTISLQPGASVADGHRAGVDLADGVQDRRRAE